MIHSIGEIPANVDRDYYLYILDYGWKEPIGEAVLNNFNKMADVASKSNAVVFRGTVGHHFSDEVLSWHNVNGLDGEKVLPAILITTKNPNDFSKYKMGKPADTHHNILLIPLREVCETATDVIQLINKIFKDINEKKHYKTLQYLKK